MRLLFAVFVALVAAASVSAQRGGGQPAAAGRGVAPAPQAIAPWEPTGYWVALVSDEWRYRMVTPARGDHPSVPLNAAGNAAANSWDPAKDEANGEQCRAYGAAGVMRAPGRIHITWQDDATLKIDTEAGTQTRVLGFTPAAGSDSPEAWQGRSAATWELAGARGGRGGAAPAGPRAGNLKVVTTRMRPGYLQKHGVPYSANAVLTEYFSRTVEPNGDSWLILTSIVEDPQYLTGPFIRSTHYKRLPDNNAAWEPEPCSAR